MISEVEEIALEVWEEDEMETSWDVNRLIYAAASLLTKELRSDKNQKREQG